MGTVGRYIIIKNGEKIIRYSTMGNYPSMALKKLIDWGLFEGDDEKFIKNLKKETYEDKEYVLVDFEYIIDLDTKNIKGYRLKHFFENYVPVKTIKEEIDNLKEEAIKDVEGLYGHPYNLMFGEIEELKELFESLPDEYFIPIVE